MSEPPPYSGWYANILLQRLMMQIARIASAKNATLYYIYFLEKT